VRPRPTLFRRQRDLARLLHPTASAQPQYRAELELRANRPLSIVRCDAKAGERSLDVMRWGLVPFWAKDIKVGFSNINAKAEGIEGKPAFRVEEDGDGQAALRNCACRPAPDGPGRPLGDLAFTSVENSVEE
jgi:putative SOS response-associated peptidase YedK